MMNPVASEEMLRNGLGDEEMQKLMVPPYLTAPKDHPLWPLAQAALREVYDPEIPVNIYELGLIYKVAFDAENNIAVEMTLTSPNCPVAGEMPQMVTDSLQTIDGIGDVKVDIVWDPSWDPSKMAETAKLQLNMF